VIPLDTVRKRDPATTKHVQRTPDGQIDLATAELLDQVQVLQMSSSARVRHGNAAPLGQPRHELVVDTLLQAFVVGGVDEEFRAVGFEAGDAFWESLVSKSCTAIQSDSRPDRSF